MHWGYAGVWPGEYMQMDDDRLFARLKFLKKFGLESTGIGLASINEMEPDYRERVGQFLVDNNLSLTPHGRPGDYFKDGQDDLLRGIDTLLADLERWRSWCRSPLYVTVVGPYHRFMDEPSLAFQMERLKFALTPLARGIHELDMNLGIENHADYYVRDLAGLCQEVPHLGIFLDTGNCFLNGEDPLPAYAIGAPHTVGTHFKDHRVRPRPDARPLHFEVGPAAIGHGHANLAEAYRLIAGNAPDPERLVMELELIPPKEDDVWETLEKSLAFIRGLEAATV